MLRCGVYFSSFKKPFFFKIPHTKQLDLPVYASTYVTKTPDIDNCIKFILDSLQKIICKNDSPVANLQATKMYDHSHTIWDEIKAKNGCTLIEVVVMNEHVVDETCDCESYNHKKKTKNLVCKKESNNIPIFHFFLHLFMCHKFSTLQILQYFFLCHLCFFLLIIPILFPYLP